MRLAALALTLAVAAGCSDSGDSQLPAENFVYAHTVRVVSPAGGDVVEPEFTLTYEAGRDVATVRVLADGRQVHEDVRADPRGMGFLRVALWAGQREVTLVGLDASGAVVARHQRTIRVQDPAEPEEAWVGLVTPIDGDEVTNPVQFWVSASEEVDSIEVHADGVRVGTMAPDEPLMHSFTGTGFARTIDLFAYAGDELVASDSTTLTVTPGSSPEVSDFNDRVMAILASYPTDGSHGYYWPSSGGWAGTTRDVWYLDTLVAEGDVEGRCYCVGLTWEVLMQAADEADRETGGDGSLNGLDVTELLSFRRDWYVRELYGSGAVEAAEWVGIGEAVTDPADLQPGDFLQFWRHNGSGHSSIFTDWELDDDGAIVGVQYWSSQGSTDGIGYRSEGFGTGSSDIDANRFYAVRVYEPADWIPLH